MSFTAAALVVLGSWCVIGLLVSVYMRRRGHAFFTWWYLGSILGPLSIPLAIDAVTRERRVRRAVVPVPVPAGKVAVLVGIDGSPAALDAARGAVALLGGRIGRCTIAYVADYDSGSPGGRDRQADAALDAAADALGTLDCDRVVLVGAAADALVAAARAGRYDVVVVGSRGRGASRAVLGSVASHLVRGVGVPVLIGGAAPASGQLASPRTTRAAP